MVQNLVIKTSIFGSGLVLNGGHPSICSKRMQFDSSVAAIRQGKFQKLNRIVTKYTQVRDFTPMDAMSTCNAAQCPQKCGVVQEKDFLQAEGLGVEAPRRCKRCRGFQRKTDVRERSCRIQTY